MSQRGSSQRYIDTYSLSMQVGGASIGIMKVAISSSVIDAVQLPLPHKEVSFAQRPRLGHRQTFEVISDFNELVVSLLKSRIDFALPGES